MKRFFSSSTNGSEFLGRTLKIEGHNVIIERLLGEGGFAFVYEAYSSNDINARFAVKRIMAHNRETLESAVLEAAYHKTFSSKSTDVVKLYGCTINGSSITNFMLQGAKTAFEIDFTKLPRTPPNVEVLLLMDICRGGSIVDVMASAPSGTYFSEPFIWASFARVVGAVSTMHSFGVTNRDLKAENLLVKQKFGCGTNIAKTTQEDAANVVLCDFGSCTRKEFTTTQEVQQLVRDSSVRNALNDEITRFTTPAYRAPEWVDLLSRMPIGRATDVWAIGVLLYRLMYFITPFTGEEPLAIYNERWWFPDDQTNKQAPALYGFEGRRIPKYSDELKAIVKMCLTKNSMKRPDIWAIAQVVSKKIKVNIAPKPAALIAQPTLAGKPAVAASNNTQQTTMRPPVVIPKGNDFFADFSAVTPIRRAESASSQTSTSNSKASLVFADFDFFNGFNTGTNLNSNKPTHQASTIALNDNQNNCHVSTTSDVISNKPGIVNNDDFLDNFAWSNSTTPPISVEAQPQKSGGMKSNATGDGSVSGDIASFNDFGFIESSNNTATLPITKSQSRLDIVNNDVFGIFGSSISQPSDRQSSQLNMIQPSATAATRVTHNPLDSSIAQPATSDNSNCIDSAFMSATTNGTFNSQSVNSSAFDSVFFNDEITAGTSNTGKVSMNLPTSQFHQQSSQNTVRTSVDNGNDFFTAAFDAKPIASSVAKQYSVDNASHSSSFADSLLLSIVESGSADKQSALSGENKIKRNESDKELFDLFDLPDVQPATGQLKLTVGGKCDVLRAPDIVNKPVVRQQQQHEENQERGNIL